MQKTIPQNFKNDRVTAILSLKKKYFPKFSEFFYDEQKLQLLGQFSKFLQFFFYMGTHYVDFTFAFNTPLIRLEMTELWPKYEAGVFAPPPLNRQLKTPLDRLKKKESSIPTKVSCR